MKKLNKTDVFFIISLFSVLLIHISFVFLVPYSEDESFYITIPFRILNGDSLVQHEWHLTQFSSLFQYLPVYIWTAVKGSLDGVFIFLRSIYLLIHTATAVVVYRFFRKHGVWAIMASMIFYVQIAYRIQAISYQSMFVIFLFMLTLCILSIYEKKAVCFYVFGGLCFGCCCVCNPLFCFAFPLYLICCVIWTKRDSIKSYIIEHKLSHNSPRGKKLTKRQKKEQKEQLDKTFPNTENYTRFFTKEAVLWFSCGIVIIAVIALAFFFSTGGTIDSILDNIKNLLGSSEYDITSKSIFSKFIDTIKFFSMANLGMPWILPAMFIALLIDKNKKSNKHRFIYLTISVFWTILFMFGVIKNLEIYVCAISLPFSIISVVCYLLTENKNKPLFYCMQVPCWIAVVFQYLAADTQWGVIGIVLAVSNIAGVFFAMDLWNEMHSVSKDDAESATKKEKKGLYCSVIIVGFCLQIAFYGFFYQYDQFPKGDAIKATTGPYSGLYMSAEKHNRYNKTISDLNYIKECSSDINPVLVISYSNWMYLYLERPMATYTTWYRGTIEPELLVRYYKENPKKTPKYVYFESSDPENANIQIANEMFEVTRENLSNGVLLTVEGCKF